MDFKNKAMLVKADGTYEEIFPKNKEDFKLEELQKYVGSDIQIIQGRGQDSNIICVLHEEGKLIGLQYNFMATLIFADILFEGDVIVGDVVICDSKLVK